MGVEEVDEGALTMLRVTTVAPCACAPDDAWIHGFTVKDGRRHGIYIAALRTFGSVRFVDVAATFGEGTGAVGLRVFVDVKTGATRARVVAPFEVDDHPALALGCWLEGARVLKLGLDVESFATRLVLDDDRLSAHLFDDEPALPLRAISGQQPKVRPGDPSEEEGRLAQGR